MGIAVGAAKFPAKLNATLAVVLEANGPRSRRSYGKDARAAGRLARRPEVHLVDLRPSLYTVGPA